jgi:hypothetical protein
MVRIRRFGVVKTATMAAIMYMVIVLVLTVLIGLPFILIAGASARETGMTAGIVGGGVVGILLFGGIGAVVYGIGGWIMTAIGCLFYNLVAGWVGGIEVQIEGASGPAAPQWGGPYGGYPQPQYPQPQYQQPGYPPAAPPPSQYPPAGFGQG